MILLDFLHVVTPYKKKTFSEAVSSHFEERKYILVEKLLPLKESIIFLLLIVAQLQNCRKPHKGGCGVTYTIGSVHKMAMIRAFSCLCCLSYRKEKNMLSKAKG